MKCTECPEYNECSKKYNLTIRRRRCPKAKEEKVVANADRIRAMSDEELAEHLYYGFDVQYCSNDQACAKMLDTDEGIPEAKCKECVLKWLKQPADEKSATL